MEGRRQNDELELEPIGGQQTIGHLRQGLMINSLRHSLYYPSLHNINQDDAMKEEEDPL
jgi:hypothetical protein